MGQVALDIGGRRYDVNCRDGEEERLHALARIVDIRAHEAAAAVGRSGESRELLLTALLLADALDEAWTRQEATEQEAQNRIAALERVAERLEGIADGLEKTEAAP